MSHAHDRAGRGDDPTEREGEGTSRGSDSASIAELLEREQRGDYQHGLLDGRRSSLSTHLARKKPTQFGSALLAIAIELVILRSAIAKLTRQLDQCNDARVAALQRVIELARRLDSISPGWDR